jgi:hypothetical protein
LWQSEAVSTAVATTRRPPALAIVGVALLVLVGAAVLAAYIYDQGHRDRLADGIRVGGVDVGA